MANKKGYILVDIPKDCYECDFEVYDEIMEENYCAAYGSENGRMFMSSCNGRPDWCPIREEPERRFEWVGTTDPEDWLGYGYNLCMDDILGVMNE